MNKNDEPRVYDTKDLLEKLEKSAESLGDTHKEGVEGLKKRIIKQCGFIPDK